MWFAALSPDYARDWLPNLADRLLENDETTLKLLRGNPFPDDRPTWSAPCSDEYHFTDWAEHRSTGAWWTRERIGIYLRPMRRPARLSNRRPRASAETPT